jgi:uncharacterized protein
MELPSFTYHPDPVSTGAIVRSDKTCRVCGQARGFIYALTTFGPHNVDEICPWCIADGSAHEKFEVQFTDWSSIGGNRDWDEVPSAVADEIAYRTPSFAGWQQEQWFTHCGDGAVFLGAMGRKELEAAGKDAVEAIRLDSELSDTEWNSYFEALDAKHGPSAYLFQCRHCWKFGGYSDSL